MALRARDARADDYPHFVRFFAELAVPDQVPTPQRFADDIAPRALLLEDEGAPVAYAWFFALGTLGRVVHVVVDAEARGRGVGRALMNEVAKRLAAAGCTRWTLNVKPDNLPAIRLYERSGLAVRYESRSMHVPWNATTRLPRDTLAAVSAETLPDGSEDAAIEVVFEFGAGRLALARTSPDRVLLRLSDPRSPEDPSLGAAVFNTTFPGVSPFAVRSPDLARALLEGLRPHARPEHDYVNVFVEGDLPLATALAAAGATTRLEMLRMDGALSHATLADVVSS